MRPRYFRNKAYAVRWSQLGGVALHSPENGEAGSLYGHPRAGESFAWAAWWAGKNGVTLANVRDRKSHAQAIELDEEQTHRLLGQSIEGICPISHLTTVMFFTGTRNGCSRPQYEMLREVVFARPVIGAHHGMCIGADREFHEIIENLKDGPDCEPLIEGWPAEVAPILTVRGLVNCDKEWVKREPLKRNRDMSNHALCLQSRGQPVELIACPKEYSQPENGRGGTWHAIRMFQSVKVPVTIIKPDGTIS